MNTGKTLFAQIMDFLPWKRFQRINARRHGDQFATSPLPSSFASWPSHSSHTGRVCATSKSV